MQDTRELTGTISKFRLLRTAELASMLGVSQTTLWRWRQQPQIGFPQPVCLGPRLVGWKLGDITDWINENQLRGNAA